MKKGENMKKKIKIAVFMMFCIFAFTGCTNSSDKSKKVESVEDITGAKNRCPAWNDRRYICF